MKWISVSKKKPKWGELVIVAHRAHRQRKKLSVTAATYWGDDENGPFFVEGEDDVVEKPAAWMPMPPPPETSK